MCDDEKLWIGERCWKELLEKIPIPCVDVIVHRGQEFLIGWRIIIPYKNVWALIGGRMLRGESFAETAIRHCLKSGLQIYNPRYIDVYPMKFPSRHDVTICMAGELKLGVPRPTKELTRYRWYNILEMDEINPIGGNYKKMLRDWRSNFIIGDST